MSKYNCDICGFNSTKKTDYMRHINTAKHRAKVNQETNIVNQSQPNPNQTSAKPKKLEKTIVDKPQFLCPFCNSIFTRLCNLSRHKAICSKTDIDTINGIVQEKEVMILKQENEKLQKQFDEYKQQVIKQLDTYESLLRSSMAPQTINNFNFISNTYPNTPALEGQTSYTNMCEAKTMSLVELIYMYYHDNKLVIFIGDYIVKLYKKEEPKDQAVWSSDVSRLTYIIRESYKTKGNVWTYDKKGTQTKKIIIEPALNYLRETLFNYCKKNSGSIKESVLKHMITANEVIQLIDSGKLADDIVRYIAPEFYIKQIEPNEIKQIEGPKEQKPIEAKPLKDKLEAKPLKDKLEAKPLKEKLEAKPLKDKLESKPLKEKKVTVKKTKPKKIIELELDSDSESEKEFMKTLREIKAEQAKQAKQANQNLFVD